MKRLILMRHADSDWSGSNGSDHQRSLNTKGQESAKAIGHWLKTHGYVPDTVLCSDATRTRETLELLGLQNAAVSHLRTLYLASPAEILATLQEATGNTVLLIGHNPGCGICAQQLPTKSKIREYPPAATSIIEFEIEDWSQAGWGIGNLAEFVVPRDLPKAT